MRLFTAGVELKEDLGLHVEERKEAGEERDVKRDLFLLCLPPRRVGAHMATTMTTAASGCLGVYSR